MASVPEKTLPHSPLLRRILIVAFSIVVVFFAAAAIAIHALKPRIHAMVRDKTAKVLESHFQSQIEFDDFEVSLYPRVYVTITGLVMRHHGRTDIPPLVQVRKATVYANLRSVLRGDPHIALVVLDGLQIHTPPRSSSGPPLFSKTDQDLAKKYPAFIEELRADDALIVVLPSQTGKTPREFPIHHLLLRNLSFDRPADFQASLENAMPTGEINATGQFGPWNAEEPADTPGAGKYTFRNADMGTLKGLSGTLSSDGSFSGPLDYLKVDGTTDIPNFSLRTSDHPMALHTDFSAIVDGTNGDTYLNSVTAKFLHTTLDVKGEIVDVSRDIKGRTIVLDAVSRNARAEDLILIAVKGGGPPIMTGAVQLRAHIDIPEGESDLLSRLKLKGQFGIDQGQFTSTQVQGKIDTLSRKGQGHPKDMDIAGVDSQMKGSFQMGNAVMDFSNLSFDVPGASINLSGTYGLDSGALDFHGKLMLNAKLSQMTTGVKSFFLKAVDPFFEKGTTGTVLSIRITGTKDHPSFGLDHGGGSNKNEPTQAKTGH